MNLTKEQREMVVEELLKRNEVREIYDKYIIDEITFREWVEGALDDCLNPRDGEKILKEIEKDINRD